MKVKHSLFSILAVSIFLVSCDKDNEPDEPNTSYDIPSTYEFSRNNENTVSYSGQQDRLGMLSEISSHMKAEENWPLNADDLKNMYSNENNPFSSDDLNASSKQLKSKTAASADFFSSNTVGQASIRADFNAWIDNVAQASVSGENAGAAGSAGVVDGGRLVGENGIEWQQVFEKSLMGACFLDQTLNNYLSTAVLDGGSAREDNDNGITEEGKPYTTMEHKWDEAFGYIYGIPELFWDKYIVKVETDEDFKGTSGAIAKAFRTGRAAISNKDYTTRDEQAEIIREKLSMVCGIRAAYYLQAAKEKLTPDVSAAFHDLSEGYGFIYSLQFTRKPGTQEPYFTGAEVEEMLNTLTKGENGFWDVDHLNSILDQLSEQIANEFGFNVDQV